MEILSRFTGGVRRRRGGGGEARKEEASESKKREEKEKNLFSSRAPPGRARPRRRSDESHGNLPQTAQLDVPEIRPQLRSPRPLNGISDARHRLHDKGRQRKALQGSGKKAAVGIKTSQASRVCLSRPTKKRERQTRGDPIERGRLFPGALRPSKAPPNAT